MHHNTSSYHDFRKGVPHITGAIIVAREYIYTLVFEVIISNHAS